MTEQRRKPHPLAAAMEWVAKITTVALEMFLPAVAGAWLDRRLGTTHWALAGVVLGFVVGMVHLLQMTRQRPKQAATTKSETNNGGSRGA